MLIDGVDISTWNATLLNKDIQTSTITTYDDWLRNSNNPLYFGKKESYKPIKVKLLVENINDDKALEDISNIVSKMGKCILKFEGLSFYYDCIIVSASHEKVCNGSYELNVELKSSYAYKDLVTEQLNQAFSKVIDVDGNTEVDAIVEINPTIDIVDITINGLGDPFVIRSLKQGQTVVVNSEDSTVLQNGVNKFGDFDGWEFPKLIPGLNTITCSKDNCNIAIKYKPRWV